jgi:hypothetical protein
VTLGTFVRLCGQFLVSAEGWHLMLLTLLSGGLTYALQRWLLQRMPEERSARAWNGLSWVCALLWFGPISMLPFCWVTRRRGVKHGVLALLAGLGWCALVWIALGLLEVAIGWALGSTLSAG